MEKKELDKKKIISDLTAICCICIFYAGLHLFGITCPIKYLTGISCMGCGMTRAYICLLRLDIKGAFYYHPLFFAPPLICAVYLLRGRISRKKYKLFFLTIVILFVIIYIIRMCAPDNDIVVFNPYEGKLAELFNGGR